MLEEFETDVRYLIGCGLLHLKKLADGNEGALDEKSIKSLEVLNKCITEIKKRDTPAAVNPYLIVDSKELEDAF